MSSIHLVIVLFCQLALIVCIQLFCTSCDRIVLQNISSVRLVTVLVNQLALTVIISLSLYCTICTKCFAVIQCTVFCWQIAVYCSDQIRYSAGSCLPIGTPSPRLHYCCAGLCRFVLLHLYCVPSL